MSPYQYLIFKKDPTADTMPWIQFFYELKGGIKMHPRDFMELLSIWIFDRVGGEKLGLVVGHVVSQLDIHFAQYL